jgi:DNA-directed RNA polymerase subunit delta
MVTEPLNRSDIMSLKRIIKDYKTLSQEHIDLINQHFPNGFENENLVSFVTPKGAFIKALEIRTDDAIYLFKIDKNMKVADDENQENEGAALNEFDSFKANDADDDNSEEDEKDEETDDTEAADDGGDDDDD